MICITKFHLFIGISQMRKVKIFQLFQLPLSSIHNAPIPGFWISSGIVQCFYKESSKYQLIRAEQIIIQIIKLLLRP